VSTLKNLKPEEQDVVRTQVRGLLANAEAFKKLPPDKRQQLARDLVTVVGFLADPAPGGPGAAEALANFPGLPGQKEDPTTKLQDRLATKPDLVQKDFSAPASQAGVAAMKGYVDAIQFPSFVSGLIQGVFKSIVDASIQQMQAYAQLLEAVVKNVEQYADDHVTQNNARDFLANKYPDHLQIKTDGGAPQLALKNEDNLPDFTQDFPTLGKEAPDVTDAEGEQKLVRAAQLQMARMKQQQLSTMVLLGINRIVVTDGLINAKVVIDVKTKDTATRTANASSYDRKTDHSQAADSGGWFSGQSSSSTDDHDVLVQSATTDTSTSDVQAKANLTGEVRVNFKSETVPLDKMASGDNISNINQKAQPG
jgi:hypothetical protein